MSSYNIRTVTSDMDMNYNSDDGYDLYIVDASSNNITIDLPTSYWEGLYWQFQRIENTSLKTVTINAPSGKTINGNSSISILGNEYCQMIYSNGDFICPKVVSYF